MHMVYYFYEERSHLLVDYRPQFYISDMIKIMKGNLAHQMFLLQRRAGALCGRAIVIQLLGRDGATLGESLSKTRLSEQAN